MMVDMKKKQTKEKILFWILIGAGCILYAVMVYEAFYPATVGDETFSLRLAERSYLDVIRLTAIDVHPPLYYMILKFVTDFSGIFPVQAVCLGKLASASAFLLLAVVSLTKIRKLFGNICGALFFLCIAGMPQMLNFGVGIRMYGWGMFFVVMAYLAFYEVLFSERRKRAVFSFCIYSLMGAYTHYFACIAIGALFLCWLIWIITREKTKWKEWVLCLVVIIAGYFPWIPIAIRQVLTVKEGYWIESVTVDTVISYMQFLFNPAVYRFHTGSMLGIFSILLSAGIVIWNLKKDRERVKTEEDAVGFFAASGMSIFFFEILVGVMASFLLRPVLVERYLFFAFGAFWLAFCIGLSRLERSRMQTGVYIFVLAVSAINLVSFWKVEEQRRYEWKRLEEEVLYEVRPEDVFLVNFGQVRLGLAYRMPENTVCYYWRQKTEELFLDLYDNIKDTRDEETILENLTDGNRMYYFDMLGIGEFRFQEDCQDETVSFEELGTYLMENVPVQVYCITRES